MAKNANILVHDSVSATSSIYSLCPVHRRKRNNVDDTKLIKG